MSKNTGGQAFPLNAVKSIANGMTQGGYKEIKEARPGMTLRDYFAGQALVGLSASTDDATYKFISQKAFLYADAMIAERNKDV